MRKFTIKNRQKRKYVKRQAKIINVHTSKTAFIGLLPFLLALTGFFSLLTIGAKPFTNALITLSTTIVAQSPKLSLPQVSFPEAPRMTISIPQIQLPTLPQLTLPQISFPRIPFTKGFNYLTVIVYSLFESLGNGIINTGIGIADFMTQLLKQLDPRPAFIQSTNVSIFVMKHAGEAFIFLGMQMLYFGSILLQEIQQVIHLYIQLMMLSYEISFAILSWYIDLLITLTNLSLTMMHLIIQQITYGLIWFGEMIVSIGQGIWEKIIAGTQHAMYVLGTPLRIAAVYLEMARPTLEKIGGVLETSANGLGERTSMIFNLKLAK